MDMEFTAEDLAFRDEVRAFIAENYPQELRGKQDEGDELGKEDFLSWHRILHKKGWVAPAWPVEYGGTGWTRRSAISGPKKPRAPIASA
jgi:alkylation response protein AidB-like acyl-CoA dehydrogenase